MKTKKSQVALFSLLILIFSFAIVLSSILKQKNFLEEYKYGTEKYIKEFFEDYVVENYLFAKREEIYDQLFFNSFDFFSLKTNCIFSERLMKCVNIFNYSLDFVDDPFLTEILKNVGLNFSSDIKKICFDEENENCDVIIEKEEDGEENFFNLFFEIYREINNENEMKNLKENVKENFEINLNNFFKILKIEEKEKLSKNLIENSKYHFFIDQMNKIKPKDVIKEKNPSFFYLIERDYLIICEEKYLVRIKPIFNFIEWERDNINAFSCLAFKIEDFLTVQVFIKGFPSIKEFKRNLKNEFFNNLIYINSYSKSKISGGHNNKLDLINDIFKIKDSNSPIELKKYEKITTLFFENNKIILFTHDIGVLIKENNKKEFVIKVKNSCLNSSFSNFSLIENSEEWEKFLKERELKKEDLIIESKENIMENLFFFYKLFDKKNNKNFCILSKIEIDNI